VFDAAEVRASVGEFREAFPGAGIYYALKANSEPAVLRAVADTGCGFEAASWPEIDAVLALGIPPGRIIYGTAVKPAAHVRAASAAGVDRFAADSREEIAMLAETAPGARVFVRLKADDSHSVFQLNGKFGTDRGTAVELLLQARASGLVPWGLSFNVGSQASRATAWGDGVRSLVPLVHQLHRCGVKLDVINLGGGFPAVYDGHPAMSLADIAGHVRTAAAELPYPADFIVEPGRRMVAHAVTLFATVVSRVTRPDGTWLFLDCGVYNALFEALACQGRTRYPVQRVGRRGGTCGATARFHLAGPTGDGLDVIARDVRLPADTAVGDVLEFENAGAYTLSLACSFNGFAPPPLRVLAR
jgi:ornithine decarboxylase